MTASIDDLVQGVTSSTLQEAAQTLISVGAAPTPAIHLFRDDDYVGWISCRPYQPGPDLHNAIAAMAWTAAAAHATRLLVVWEDFTLRTFLHGEGRYRRSMMVADVPAFGPHTLRWWPFALSPADGHHAAAFVWDENPAEQVGQELPPPVQEAIAIWRANRGRLDLENTVADALSNDYRVSLPGV